MVQKLKNTKSTEGDAASGHPRQFLWLLLAGSLLLGLAGSACDSTCEKVQVKRQRCAENAAQAKVVQKEGDAAKAACKKDAARLQECLALDSCEDFNVCADRALGTHGSTAKR